MEQIKIPSDILKIQNKINEKKKQISGVDLKAIENMINTLETLDSQKEIKYNLEDLIFNLQEDHRKNTSPYLNTISLIQPLIPRVDDKINKIKNLDNRSSEEVGGRRRRRRNKKSKKSRKSKKSKKH